MIEPAHNPRLPWLLLALGLPAAFVAAFALKDTGILSLTPPATTATPFPEPDAVGKEAALYASAFTAWVAPVLLVPVYVTVWFSQHRETWLAYWAASYVAYVIHLAVSLFWFFDGSVAAAATSSRVSAFGPGMLILVWWLIDIVLAYRGVAGRWVTYQRVVVHLLVLVLFVGGSAVMGETALVQLIGWALAGAAVGAVVVARINRSRAA